MDNKQYYQNINEARDFILNKLQGFAPEIAVVLGSGLGDFADLLTDTITISYADIPHFAKSSVAAHKGMLVAGKINGKNILCMQGRFHFYEGYDLRTVTFPVRVFKAIGINNLIVTNAAGGINTSFNAGALMLITDHINLSGSNPLIGENLDELGARFPDMSFAYNPNYIEKAKNIAKKLDIDLKSGVYAWFTGPNYETPAEVRFAKFAGADAVGMSTVPEVIVANHMKMNVLGISCITNMAAGILNQKLNHSEVTETANRVKSTFETLLKNIIGEIDE